MRVETTGCDVVSMAPYLEAEIVEERLWRPVAEHRSAPVRFRSIADPELTVPLPCFIEIAPTSEYACLASCC